MYNYVILMHCSISCSMVYTMSMDPQQVNWISSYEYFCINLKCYVCQTIQALKSTYTINNVVLGVSSEQRRPVSKIHINTCTRKGSIANRIIDKLITNH
jgi:hypothetical protein